MTGRGKARIVYLSPDRLEDPMADLLVIADDLTGALDSGVQLSRKGQRVLVSLDCEGGLSHAKDADVIVIDSESRHDDAQAAYQKVRDLVSKSRGLGIRRVYKKTDSGLRGNVGAELAGALDASGATHLNFAPAYPKQQRTTSEGIHYVAGTPLAQSFFSVDPLNPVHHSKVADLVHEQSDVAVHSWHEGLVAQGIVVFDCETDEDMARVARVIAADGPDVPMAGSAGLLEMLPCDPCAGRTREAIELPRQLVVVSGSVNAVTSSQLDEAERRGAHRVHLPLKEILAGDWGEAEARAFVASALEDAADAPVVLMDTLGYQLSASEIGDGTGARLISEAASLVAAVVSDRRDRTLMIVGGDALVGFVDQVGATMLEPLDEVFPGIVIARHEGGCTEGTIVTKSGAFGGVGLFFDIYEALGNQR